MIQRQRDSLWICTLCETSSPRLGKTNQCSLFVPIEKTKTITECLYCNLFIRWNSMFMVSWFSFYTIFITLLALRRQLNCPMFNFTIIFPLFNGTTFTSRRAPGTRVTRVETRPKPLSWSHGHTLEPMGNQHMTIYTATAQIVNVTESTVHHNTNVPLSKHYHSKHLRVLSIICLQLELG